MNSPKPYPVLVHHFQSTTPGTRAYEHGDANSRNAVVFIGGLGDGPHTVPYVKPVADRFCTGNAVALSYSIFEIRIASSFGGYGYSSLASDVADISALVEYLRGLGKEKIVLFGHSTGFQDCMEYTNYDRHEATPVDKFIIQGPVSDRESLVELVDEDDMTEISELAAKMIAEGKQNDCLPHDLVASYFSTPMTAYRWDSLVRKGGDDDYFSSDLSPEFLTAAWGRFDKPVLVLHSAEDEHVPRHVDKEALIERWKAASPQISPLSGLIPGANHTVAAPVAQTWLADTVVRFLQGLGSGKAA